MISLKFFNNNNRFTKVNKSSLDFTEIRNKFINFYNAYIDLNELFIHNQKENQIIKDIVNELISNVIHRSENLNLKYPNKIDDIKEVVLLKDINETAIKSTINVDLEI